MRVGCTHGLSLLTSEALFSAVADAVATRLHARTEALYRALMTDPDLAGILIDPDHFAKALHPKILEESSKVFFEGSYGSLDAASLIFFHSALDAAAFDFCRVTALHAPADWESDIRNTKIPILDAKTQSYEQLLGAKVAERIESLEQEGVMLKVDKLFARCQPKPGYAPLYGCAYDRDKLKQFDLQRHEIIHGSALGKPLIHFPLTEPNVYYLLQTGMYLFVLVHSKYALQIDPKYMAELWQQRTR